MRYCLEFAPNPDVLEVHFDKKVVRIIQFYHWPDEDVETQSQLVRDLFNIDGIVRVSLSPYSIWLEKGVVFEWRRMISAILHCLQVNLDPDEELTEARPPTQTRINGQGIVREEPFAQELTREES